MYIHKYAFLFLLFVGVEMVPVMLSCDVKYKHRKECVSDCFCKWCFTDHKCFDANSNFKCNNSTSIRENCHSEAVGFRIAIFTIMGLGGSVWIFRMVIYELPQDFQQR